MKGCIALLIAALLLNTAFSRAEEQIFYTNYEDRYYHADADCDRPIAKNWWDDSETAYYQRTIYKKYEISEKAALAFEKKACPICVKALQPVYLGEAMPEWNYQAAPWEISGLSDAQETAFRSMRSEAYQMEIVYTSEAFSDYYEESYNDETDQIQRKHAYPACFAGKYACNAGCVAYALVDFDEEMLSAFKEKFGGGAWIVPAKYGYDEIYQSREQVLEALNMWCKAHPEADARPVSAVGPDYENYAVIGINGADWQRAAAAMEEIAPIYIHFSWAEMNWTI